METYDSMIEIPRLHCILRGGVRQMEPIGVSDMVVAEWNVYPIATKIKNGAEGAVISEWVIWHPIYTHREYSYNDYMAYGACLHHVLTELSSIDALVYSGVNKERGSARVVSLHKNDGGDEPEKAAWSIISTGARVKGYGDRTYNTIDTTIRRCSKEVIGILRANSDNGVLADKVVPITRKDLVTKHLSNNV